MTDPIAYTTSFDEDGSEIVVETHADGDGIKEKKFVDGVDQSDKEAVKAAKANKKATQEKVEADAAEAEKAAEAGVTTTNQEGNPMTDTSNNYDIPEPPEKTAQQLHDEKVTAGNAAGPANAGVSTGEWVDAQQEEGVLPSDEEANAAREDGPGATGDPATVPAEPANPNVDKANKPKKPS